MTKIELLNEITRLRESNEFLLTVINKLIQDYVEIRPKPRGNLKDRIVVFIKPITIKKGTLKFKKLIVCGSINWKTIPLKKKNERIS